MKDDTLQWAIQVLAGSVEIVERQVKARTEIDGQYVAQLPKLFERIEAVCDEAERKKV